MWSCAVYSNKAVLLPAQVWTPFLPFFYNTPEQQLRNPPKKYQHKQNAIIYISSNCSPQNGRNELMTQLQHLLLQVSNSSLAIHSYGRCNSNMDPQMLAAFQSTHSKVHSRTAAKKQYMPKYKFCVVSGLCCCSCMGWFLQGPCVLTLLDVLLVITR